MEGTMPSCTIKKSERRSTRNFKATAGIGIGETLASGLELNVTARGGENVIQWGGGRIDPYA